jgi:hypothetical protein
MFPIHTMLADHGAGLKTVNISGWLVSNIFRLCLFVYLEIHVDPPPLAISICNNQSAHTSSTLFVKIIFRHAYFAFIFVAIYL